MALPTNTRVMRFKDEQIIALERLYSQCPTPTALQRQQLIVECPTLADMDSKHIYVWFQNRRRREKRQQEACRNKELFAINKLLREEIDRLEKQVWQLVYENKCMKQQLQLETVSNSPKPLEEQDIPHSFPAIAEETREEFLSKGTGNAFNRVQMIRSMTPGPSSIGMVDCSGVAAALEPTMALQLESSGEFHYGVGLQQPPSVLKTFSQRLWRGFSDAMNGSLDDGWSLKSDDSVTIAVNKSPNKFFVEGGGIICAKASIEIKNVTPALLVRFLREHRSEWAGYGADAYSPVRCQKASQVITPLGHEEFLEVVHIDGQALSMNDMHLLQLYSGVDENSLGGCAHLLFAPIHESFAFEDDAFLLPSGFRIMPLEYPKTVGPTANTLDYNIGSVLKIVFQYDFKKDNENDMADFARTYLLTVVSSLQNLAMAGRFSPLSSFSNIT